MDHATAQQLMAAYDRLSNALNDATHIVLALPEQERATHLRALAWMMAHLWGELQLPVVREHRDLDPDGDRFQRKPG